MLTHRHRTILGNIPADWDAKPLKWLISEHFAGDWGDDEGEQTVSVLRSTNFTNDGQLDFSDIARRYFPKIQADQFGLLKGDLLVERSGGGPEQPVGRIGFIESDMPGTTVSNFVQVIRPNAARVNASFLGWALFELQRTGIVERVQQQSTQMRNLNWRDYQRLMLPHPGLDEQQRIASVIQLSDDAIQKTSAELGTASEAMRSLLRELFANGLKQPDGLYSSKWITCPRHWEIKALKSFASVTSGFTMGRDLSRHETVSVPYVTVVNVQDGYFELNDIGSIEIKMEELNTDLLEHGDILMTEGGDRDKLGRGGMWREEISPCSYQNHIFRVRLNPGEYRPELFHFLIQTHQAKSYFYAHAKQTNNLCTINSRELKNWQVPIPPVDEQIAMVALLQAAESRVRSTREKLLALHEIKSVLLRNLLTGAIRIPEGAING
jgi:type I restriction enzyme S subunit